MNLTREQFIAALREHRLVTDADLNAAEPDIRVLVQRLIHDGKLTRYQAEAVYHGAARALFYGEYVVVDRLGGGGMGRVYKARHRRMKRLVALKMLPASALKAPDAIERFGREVEAAAQLIHPNIVTAYDAGEAHGVRFLVMEYVDGCDLAAVVKSRGPLPLDAAIDCTTQAAKGLAYAHARGIIHRDVKPANLLLDRQGAVKILDMGLARFEQEAAHADANAATAGGLTQAGQVMGTADYMAPEQALDTRHASPRADIYSLGCTLYTLLTAEPLHAGTTFIEKLVAHRERPTPDLALRRPDAPPHLIDAFQRMVAKDPADRFQSMTEVAAALESCRSLVPASTAGPAPVSHSMLNAGRSGVATADHPIERAELGRPGSASRSGVDSRTFNDPPPRRTQKRWLAPLALTCAVAGIAVVAFMMLRPGHRQSRDAAGLSDQPSGGSSAAAASRVPLTQASARIEPTPPSYRPEDGWIPLFNGRDLFGWHTLDGQPASVAAFQGEWRILPHVLWEAATTAATRTGAAAAGASANFGLRLLVRRAGIAVTRVHLVTDRSFGDLQLHAEVLVPERGAMGLCLMELYELRIQPGVPLFAGGIPGIAGPTTQALRPTNQWQTLDVDFRAPRFDDAGHKIQSARILSARLNGRLIHYDVELRRPSGQLPMGNELEAPAAPLMLRDLGAFAVRTLVVHPTGPTTTPATRAKP
jgi:serine/threonine protein kinase